MMKRKTFLLAVLIICALGACSASVDNSGKFEGGARSLAETFVQTLHEKSAKEWFQDFHPKSGIREQDLNYLISNSSDLGVPTIGAVTLLGKDRKMTEEGVVFMYAYGIEAEYSSWLGKWEVIIYHNKKHYLGGVTVKSMVSKSKS